MQNFSFPAQNRNEKFTEKKIDKGKRFTAVRPIRGDNSDVDSNDNGKIHFVSRAPDSEFYNTIIWMNFLKLQNRRINSVFLRTKRSLVFPSS